MLVTLVGDVHGDTNSIKNIPPRAIQLGDFDLYGYGVYSCSLPIFMIDGNHDALKNLILDAEKPYTVAPGLYHIPRGYVSGRVMFIGGGDSIDKMYRIPGVSWFQEECVSRDQIDRICSVGSDAIDVVISHDAPHFALAGMKLTFGIKKMLPCSLAFDEICWALKPSLWIHAHYHFSYETTKEGCLFVGLDVNEQREFDIPISEDFFDKFK